MAGLLKFSQKCLLVNYPKYRVSENIKKFRQETAKLDQTKEIQSVREFYKKIEKELPSDKVEKLKDTFQSVRNKMRDDAQQFIKHEAIKKGFDNISKASAQVKDATRSLSDSEIVKAARKLLKTRAEITGKTEERVFQPDNESSGVVVHKDSKWFAAWQDFKDNNQYVQKLFDMKSNYNESDHMAVRSMRFMTSRISEVFGSIGSENQLQLVLDEITKVDPSFSTDDFINYCRFTVIPNVLEAIIQGNLNILKDWCHDGQMKDMGCFSESRILDVSNLDVIMGKITEQGPILIITFQAQQITCYRDKTGNVVEGDPNKVLRVNHAWILCRDQNELHPWAAWRVMEVSMIPSDQWL